MTRPLSSFNEIVVNDKIEVTIYKGNEYKVDIIAGRNLIKTLATTVSGNTLTIDNNNKCNFVRGYKHVIKMNVYVPYIKLVSNNGVSTLRFAEDFAQDTLVVRIENSGDVVVNGTFNQIRSSTHGNGDTYLNGATNSFLVYTNGTNFIHAENLVVKDYLYIQTLTLGDCIINTHGLGLLDYNIESSGNILYTGNPKIINNNSKGTGTGVARKID